MSTRSHGLPAWRHIAFELGSFMLVRAARAAGRPETRFSTNICRGTTRPLRRVVSTCPWHRQHRGECDFEWSLRVEPSCLISMVGKPLSPRPSRSPQDWRRSALQLSRSRRVLRMAGMGQQYALRDATPNGSVAPEPPILGSSLGKGRFEGLTSPATSS